MSTSQRLTVSHVRAVFRLIGEVHELGASPPVWRRHMLEGLAEIVGGVRCHAGEAPLTCSPTQPQFQGVVIHGVTEPHLLAIYHDLIFTRDYADDPTIEAMSKLIHGSFTCTRRQLADDRRWYRRRDLDAWRTLGCDHFIYSHQFMPTRGCIHLISINRGWGVKPFSERERRILDLFHEELGMVLRQKAHDPCAGLAPRLRQTLDRLLEGDSEKQIAAALDLSRHTIHGYVKDLYRRFGVGTHPELMARLLRPPPPHTPRLVADENIQRCWN